MENEYIEISRGVVIDKITGIIRGIFEKNPGVLYLKENIYAVYPEIKHTDIENSIKILLEESFIVEVDSKYKKFTQGNADKNAETVEKIVAITDLINKLENEPVETIEEKRDGVEDLISQCPPESISREIRFRWFSILAKCRYKGLFRQIPFLAENYFEEFAALIDSYPDDEKTNDWLIHNLKYALYDIACSMNNKSDDLRKWFRQKLVERTGNSMESIFADEIFNMLSFGFHESKKDIFEKAILEIDQYNKPILMDENQIFMIVSEMEMAILEEIKELNDMTKEFIYQIKKIPKISENDFEMIIESGIQIAELTDDRELKSFCDELKKET